MENKQELIKQLLIEASALDELSEEPNTIEEVIEICDKGVPALLAIKVLMEKLKELGVTMEEITEVFNQE